MSDPSHFVITSALTDISNTFKKAVNAFNTQNGKALSETLDQNVVLYRKRDGAIIASGQGDVLAALEILFAPIGTGTTPATFYPLTTRSRPVVLPVIISGRAAWHDNDGSSDDIIKYEFTFNPANLLILSLWAQHK